MNVFEAIRCKKTSRKLSAYLDLDKGAELTPSQISDMKEHLSECQKCSEKLAHFSEMRGALGNLGRGIKEDKERLDSIKKRIDDLLEGLQ